MNAKSITDLHGEAVYREKGSRILGCANDLLEAPLDFITKVHRSNEPIVEINIPLMDMAMVCDAELINEILTDKSDSFRKSDRDVKHLSDLLGHGLITSNGEEHRTKKKRVIPAFKVRCFQHYIDKANIETANYVKSIVPGEYRDIDKDMVNITFMTNMRILFGDDIADAKKELSEISLAIDELSQILINRMTSAFVAPDWLPTKENRIVRELKKTLFETVDKLIFERLSGEEPCEDRNDVLSMLVTEMKATEDRFDIDAIRGELLTLFVAGYETTAATLNWTLYYLSQSPAILKNVQKEVDGITSSDELSFEECQSLEYTDMVLRETLRISTAVWAIVDRQANRDIQIGDVIIPKDKILFLSTYGVHKNPKYFADPETFDPERFSETNKKQIIKGSYFPFGMGQRICIGAGLSVVIMKSVLFGLMRKYDVVLNPSQKIGEEPNLSLKCKYGLSMKFEDRS